MSTEKLQNTVFWTRSAILLALALVLQLGGFPQPVTGPGINAVLFLAAMIVGPLAGIAIGIFTPVMGFLRGILPPVLAPMIPFIAAGNAMLVLVYFILTRFLPGNKDSTFTPGRIVSMIIASAAKFLLLASAVTFLVEVPQPAAQMMTMPQLYTALAGGLIALLAYRALPLE